MKLIVKKGRTSFLVKLFIQDSSATTGAGLTGLAFNTSSLVCYRARDDDGNAGGTAITLATATKGTWASGGFVEKDATNMPGVYEFGIPDNALVTGSETCVIILKGATNMAPVVLEIQLVAYDPQDGVRAGLTALPNAAAEAAGGLYTRGTGAGQIRQDANGRIDANAKAWIDGTIPAVNITGVPLVDAKYLLGTIFSTPTVAGIPNVNAKTWNDLATVALPLVPTVAGRALDVSAGGEAGLDWANVGSPTTSLALTGTTIATTQKVDVDTIKTNPVVNGGTITFPTTATLASTTNITAGTIATVTNLTNAPTAGDFTATMKTSLNAATPASVVGAVGSVTGLTASDVGAIKAKTDNLPASPAAVGSAMALTSGERNSVADAMLDRDMSTGADSGSTTVRTPRQALRFLRNKWAIVTGTLSVYKEDDATPSWTSAVTTDAAAVPVVSNDPAGP